MSWQEYIDRINQDVMVDEVAICGLKTGEEQVWGSTKNFAGITPEQIRYLIDKRSSHGSSGPVIAGYKCRLIRDNFDTENMFSIDLKTSADADGQSYNVCVGHSKLALIIIKGTKDANGGHVSGKVFETINHLKSINY